MEEQEIPSSPLPKNEHLADLVDHYWGSINYVTSLIKASELKAGLILSFYGILLNFIYQGTGTIVASVTHDTVFYVLLALWVVCTSISVYYCVRCFIPKIEGNYDRNMFFFGDVISKFGNIKEFAKTFYDVSRNEDMLFEQLGEQIFIISKIAAWKFKNVKRAIRFLAIGLLLLFATAGYYAIIMMT